MAATTSSYGAKTIVCGYASFATASLLVGLRVYVRSKLIQAFEKEDICVVVSLVCLVMLTYFNKTGLTFHEASITNM